MTTRIRLAAAAASLAAAALAAPAADAQVVRVRASDAASGAPVDGVVASLVDSAGRRIASALAGADGIAILGPPTAGEYRVRAERTGYAVWTTPSVLALDPARRDTLGLAAPLTEQQRRLDAVVVTSEARCDAAGRRGGAPSSLSAVTVWEEASKALLANALGERMGRVPLRVRTVQRELSTSGAIVRERADPPREVTGSPFVTLPAESLNTAGYVRETPEGVRFFAPDAAVLLSPGFAETHCFQAVRGEGERSGLVGLAFEPTRTGERPDIRGTLWLDGATSELRHVEYEYVDLPTEELRATPDARATGRTEFARTPLGDWIVRRWHIRMPVLGRWRTSLSREAARVPGAPRTAPHSVIGYVERAGEAEPLGGGAPAVVAGVVYDSVAGLPLAGAEVVVGGVHRALTDSAGRFRIAVPMTGEYAVRVRHPMLVAAGLGTVGATLPLVAGDSLNLTAAIPSAPTLRAARCAARPDPGGALVAGAVLDTADAPVADAGVVLRLSGDAVVQPGASALVSRHGIVHQGATDASGTFRLCHLPPDASGTLEVVQDGRVVASARVAVTGDGTALLVVRPGGGLVRAP